MDELVAFKAGRSTGTGYLEVPEQREGPGVLLLHAWWGLNGFFKELTGRLASEGFVVLAPDLYHGETASTIEEARRLCSKMDGAAVERELVGAVNYLRSHPSVGGSKVGVVGFSMGAFRALWLADKRPDDIAAVVAFYGTRKGSYAKTGSAFLCHFAEKDKWVPDGSAQQLEGLLAAAGREASVHVYPDTSHWFFEEDQPDAYNPDAARLAWERTVTFLRGTLK